MITCSCENSNLIDFTAILMHMLLVYDPVALFRAYKNTDILGGLFLFFFYFLITTKKQQTYTCHVFDTIELSL